MHNERKVLYMAATRRAEVNGTGRVTQRDLDESETFAELMRLAIGDARQAQVAREIGVSQSRISRWLRDSTPDETTIPRVAHWLGIPERALREFLAAKHARPGLRQSTSERLGDIEDVLEELRTEIQALSNLVRRQR